MLNSWLKQNNLILPKKEPARYSLHGKHTVKYHWTRRGSSFRWILTLIYATTFISFVVFNLSGNSVQDVFILFLLPSVLAETLQWCQFSFYIWAPHKHDLFLFVWRSPWCCFNVRLQQVTRERVYPKVKPAMQQLLYFSGCDGRFFVVVSVTVQLDKIHLIQRKFPFRAALCADAERESSQVLPVRQFVSHRFY